MAYATVEDVQKRIPRTLTADEQALCAVLLDDAAVEIDAVKADASADAKLVVSCRMVIRVLGDGEASCIPLGASQGSMTGLNYTNSWTMGSGGAVGELYLGKTDRQILGCSNNIGSHSPVEDLCVRASLWA